MKNTTSEIFDLVKSLTKAEKRYFHLYAGRHFSKDNQYLRLFQSIEVRDTYDEAALIKAFSKNMSDSHFAVLKKQLYENVLDALHRFDEYAHPEQQVRKGLHYCTLLLKKGLFAQCRKQIVKYKEKAYAIEKFEHVIELIDIEKRLISRQQYTAHSFEQLQQLMDEQNNCLKQIEIIGNYWIKSSKIFKMHAEKIIAAGKKNSMLQDLIANDPYFKTGEYAVNMRAKLDHLQVNALYAFVTGDTTGAYQLNTEFLDLLDQQPQFRFLYADRYFSVLNNYLIDSLVLQKYEQLIAGIKILRGLPSQKEFRHINNLEANVFRLSYSLEMNYYVSTHQFAMALKNEPAIKEGIKKHIKKISKPARFTLQYLIAYAFFCNSQYDACLEELNHILQVKDAEIVPDIYRDSRMMQLLAHFALGNYQLLESLLVSMQRLLAADKLRLNTHKLILKYVKQFSQKLQKPSSELLYAELEKISLAESESIAFNNFDYLHWAGKLNGRSEISNK